ncbi:MAG: transposase [Candidatus Shapirobacteria bacterium]
MSTFADSYRVESVRKIGWNYSNAGIYFITICTLNKNKLFGKIVDGEMVFNKCGLIANQQILKTIDIRKNILISDWVVMPNHVHILIMLRDLVVETPRGASLHENPKQITVIPSHKNHPEFYKRMNLKSNQEIPKIINQYKSCVTKICRQNKFWFGWQSRYYDEIIDDEKRFRTIKYYIKNNPKNWVKDKLHIN